jgi:hypothetical protein
MLFVACVEVDERDVKIVVKVTDYVMLGKREVPRVFINITVNPSMYSPTELSQLSFLGELADHFQQIQRNPADHTDSESVAKHACILLLADSGRDP